MKKILLLLLLPLSAMANGLPNLKLGEPGAPHLLETANGKCVWWYVYEGAGHKARVYCGTPAEAARSLSRIQTIANQKTEAARAKSLDTLKNRIAMSEIRCSGLVCETDDAALKPIVADLNAARQ